MKHSGFTLLELLTTIAIAGIVLAMAIPSFQSGIKSNRLASTSNNLIGALNYARLEAVKRGSQVFVGQRNGSNWTGGIVVWADDPDQTIGIGSWNSGEELRLWDAAQSSSNITSSNSLSSFQFQPSGELNNHDTIMVCDDRVGEQGYKITLLVSGLIASQRSTCV